MRCLFSLMVLASAMAVASPGQLQAQCRGGVCYSGYSGYSCGTNYCGNVYYSNCGGGMRYSNCGTNYCGGGMRYSNCGTNYCGGGMRYSNCGTSCGQVVYYYGGGYCRGMRMMSCGSCSSCMAGKPTESYEAKPKEGEKSEEEKALKIPAPGADEAKEQPKPEEKPAEATKSEAEGKET